MRCFASILRNVALPRAWILCSLAIAGCSDKAPSSQSLHRSDELTTDRIERMMESLRATDNPCRDLVDGRLVLEQPERELEAKVRAANRFAAQFGFDNCKEYGKVYTRIKVCKRIVDARAELEKRRVLLRRSVDELDDILKRGLPKEGRDRVAANLDATKAELAKVESERVEDGGVTEREVVLYRTYEPQLSALLSDPAER